MAILKTKGARVVGKAGDDPYSHKNRIESRKRKRKWERERERGN